MTGYGESKQEIEGISVNFRIYTLNHRYRDIQINCSEEIPYKWQKNIIGKTKNKIERGKIFIDVKIIRKKPPFCSLTINKELLSHYYENLTSLIKILGLKDEIKLSHLLTVPGITIIKTGEDAKVENLVYQTCEEALSELTIERNQEGTNHLMAIRRCLKNIRSCFSKVKKGAPQIRRQYREKIEKELSKITSEKEKPLLIREIANLLMRGDINEELVRFSSHLEQFQKTLRVKKPMGKRLTFIIQEMNREINTIGSKANNLEITKQVVEVKSQIENIREQIQNIE